jgi:DNA-binding transcriptional regulator PaaX
MNANKNKRKNNITALLRMIQDEMVEVTELFEQWANRKPYRLDAEHRLAEERYQADRQYRNRLAHLRRRKLVRTKKIEGRLFVELSNEGKMELKKRFMRERPKLPDGFTCLVLFDFPVEARRGRDAFRRFLKNAGFEQVQKSAWRSDHDVIHDVQEFSKSSRIQKWVDVFLARKQ